MLTRTCLRLCFLALAIILTTGCIHPVGKVVLTPVTVVRDVVDAPLVSLTNVFETFADWSNPRQAPNPWVGWDWKSGFNFGIGYGIGFFFFKGLSGIVGGIDYVICRSFYPSWPSGLSPWKKEKQSWGDLYFPNTRAMWGDHPPDTADEVPIEDPEQELPPPEAYPAQQPSGARPQTTR